MKKKQLDEIKTKTTDELRLAVSDLRDEIGKIKTEMSLGREKNTNLLKNKKKELARVLTFLTMKMTVEDKARKEVAPAKQGA